MKINDKKIVKQVIKHLKYNGVSVNNQIESLIIKCIIREIVDEYNRNDNLLTILYYVSNLSLEDVNKAVNILNEYIFHEYKNDYKMFKSVFCSDDGIIVMILSDNFRNHLNRKFSRIKAKTTERIITNE